MTFPTPHLRFSYMLFGLLTKRRQLDAPLKDGRERPANGGVQTQMLTGIGARDSGNRAGPAQVR